MARPTKPTSDIASIESEIAVLKTKLTDHEHRHADALAALEDGREARRKLLTKDDKTIAEATKKIRDLQFAADDAGSLVTDYRNELADAERRLIDATAADQRETAARALTAFADTVSALVPDLAATVSAFMAVRKKMLDAVPADGMALAHGEYCGRPNERPEGQYSDLSAREMINAVIAEALFDADATMFDSEHKAGGSKITLAKFASLEPHGFRFVEWSDGKTLSPGAAVQTLLVKPAQTRANKILASDEEPDLRRIKAIDHTKPKLLPKVEIIATKPLKFVAPNDQDGRGYFRHHITEGRTESVIEPIARLAIAKRAALEFQSPAGQAFRADFEERVKTGRVAQEPRDTVDLGDPMGCMEPANDDDEINKEVERALG